MICLRHLIRSKAVTNRIFFSQKGDIFLFATYYLELLSDRGAMISYDYWYLKGEGGEKGVVTATGDLVSIPDDMIIFLTDKINVCL